MSSGLPSSDLHPTPTPLDAEAETEAEAAIMPSRTSACVMGIDVGGTNTDCVILQGERVLAWHKTPTTPDIQSGIETSIDAVIKKANIEPDQIDTVKIGTTQFVNAVVEEDASKLDKVAVIRLCGPYTQGSPPFADFSPPLRRLMEGHFAYVDGGLQLDGTPIMPLGVEQLKQQAAIIKAKGIPSVVVIGVYSPSNSTQEDEAAKILAEELGPGFDISCSSQVGRLGFLERENASILNASLRRFARHVIAGFVYAIKRLRKCRLYITLNDGTLSRASTATEYPIRCFSSGPTNSARGAALLAKAAATDESDDREVIVVDIGGTTTDICVLLGTGYPTQSAAFVKIAGVRTNFTIPDVHNIALGGGSLIRRLEGRTSVGPDSVGSELEKVGIAFGGETLTATDLVLENIFTQKHVSEEEKSTGMQEIVRMLEEGIELVKTKPGNARVILVGGGSIIVKDGLMGVGEIIRPEFLEVANAIGAAVAKVSGTVDMTIVPGEKTREQESDAAKALAIERCVQAGGRRDTIELIEMEDLPMSYVNNQAYRLVVRVAGDVVAGYGDSSEYLEPLLGSHSLEDLKFAPSTKNFQDPSAISKGSSYDILEHVDLNAYRPRIEGDYWYLSEIDLAFLNDGTGILAVGSTGEPYASYLACLVKLRNGEDIKIRRQDTFPDDGVALSVCFMGSPTVYQERLPGLTETADALRALVSAVGLKSFDAIVPNEIGGLNAIEALLAGNRFGKSVLDTDLVARAYPMIYQTVRCLNGQLVAPAVIADGMGNARVFAKTKDNEETEVLLRNASSDLGSLAAVCTSPIYGVEAKTLPPNSFSWAWTIGRSIALSRSQKLDPIPPLLASQHGKLLFTGKIISVERLVGSGFTRGSVTLESFPSPGVPSSTLRVEYENENLSAVLKEEGEQGDGRLLAICPDLITFLDKANGAPLGVSDYKYGLRVSVIALQSPPVWTSEKGLKMGGPRAFGVDMDYVSTIADKYEPPKSVWEMYGESPKAS